MTSYAGGEIVAEVVRSEFVEGYHRGSVVVVDRNGDPLAKVGDVTAPVFPRSANKPMQAVAMARAGLSLTDPADLAVVAASHWGEPQHLTRIRALLHSVGLDESALRCPPDLPLSEAERLAALRAGVAPAPVLMNCSGKHTGMLLTCLAAGWPIDDYRDRDHPLQKRIRLVIEEMTGEPVEAIGVDGCGAALMSTSLRGLATAFLRMVDADPGTPERTVADAMRAYPELISGTRADDARLMRAVPGLLAKSGAEGVAAIAIPGVGAVALKIDDGAARARMPVLVEALRRLGVTDAGVTDLGRVPVLGGGQPVGAVRAVRMR